MSFPVVALGVASLAFVCAWFATGVVRRHALHHAILDVPNSRSSHSTPTPRGGGLAVVLVYIGALALLLSAGMMQPDLALVLAVAGGAVALTGYLDDRKPLPARIRICVHVGAAALAVMLLGGVGEQTLRGVGLHGIWAGSLLGILVLTWCTNLFNFMDGIDGIAGSEAVFVAGAGAILNWRYGGDGGLTAAMVTLSAATLGFLVWNWPPASIFMGDVGSGFLGFILAVLGLAAAQHGTVRIEVWLILGGVFAMDATVTLLMRILRGDRWFEAHRQHAYQRLASRWKAHLPVTGLVIVVDLLWLFPWAWIAARHPAFAMHCALAALAPIGVAALLLGAGRRSRR